MNQKDCSGKTLKPWPVFVDHFIIIASVTHKLPEDGRRGGHLILLHGVSEKEGIVLIDFMDPSAWGRDNKSVTLERFNASFTGRGIIISGD